MTGPGISLRWKVALSVSLLLVVVSTAIALALIRYERYFLTREGEKRVLALADNLAVNARDPLLAGDDLRLAPITQSVMNVEDAVYAFVVNHELRVAYHPDGSLIGAGYPDDLPEIAGDVIEASVPIEVEGTQVGTAVVGLASGFIQEAMRATSLGLLAPLSIGTLVGVAGIFLLTGFHVQRIETLEEAVQAVAGGDLLTQADVGGQDEVSRLAGHFNRMVTKLEAARQDVEQGFLETIGALAAAIEAKDPYTRGHCDRVSSISRAIAVRMGVEDPELKDLELAALLHDVGKIGIQAKVLTKPGRLDDDETQSMQRHPEIGARILSSLSSLTNVEHYVKHHHERFDGQGYPDGLAGNEIPLASRIIHLVDAYDAMTTSRPYSSPKTHNQALAEILAGKGSHFDPAIVNIFMDLDSEGVIRAISRAVEQASVA
jgi:putative nucleotidyltransferase with HDIG domain